MMSVVHMEIRNYRRPTGRQVSKSETWREWDASASRLITPTAYRRCTTSRYQMVPEGEICGGDNIHPGAIGSTVGSWWGGGLEINGQRVVYTSEKATSYDTRPRDIKGTRTWSPSARSSM